MQKYSTSLKTTISIAALAIACAFTGTMAQAQENAEAQIAEGDNEIMESVVTLDHPMLAEWTGDYGGVPPFDKADPAKFIAAFDVAINAANAEIDAITANDEPANFDNTIAALERAGREMTRLQAVYGVHASTLNVDPMPEVERAVSPKLAAFYDSISQNAYLFERVKTIYEGKKMKKLNKAQRRLVEDNYKGFVRRGVNLDVDSKARLSEINQRLATLFTEFSQNVLADEEGYVTWLDDEDQLAGLSDSLIAGMASAAKERDQAGKWAVTNTRSSMEPFLTYADNRELREQVWRTYYDRGDNGDAHDNNAIVAEILKLRAERATLLGYETHAHWRLEPQMAKIPENAMELMEAAWPKAVARVAEEVADMQKIADGEGEGVTIEPWDYRFYAEKVRADKYALDMNAVKPYMQLEKLREGMMWAAGELYGLQFELIDNAPVYHRDVRVWKVADAKGRYAGLWYFDPFARKGKRSGAWMNAYQVQEKMDGDVKPIISNNSNFVKTTDGQPVLISWSDAETMFHEFGHALHGLLSDVKYPSQAGTAVARDYVEFPSQINEHWLPTKEVLEGYAVHYETGESIPAELVAKIKDAETFNQGFDTVEYLASALVDMKLHLAGGADIDPDKFERDTLAALGMPKEIVMRHRTPHFQHIFAGDGYSAGYYSYLWSDALTADAAEAFVEAGGFYDKKTAKRFEKYILSIGDTIDPAEGFRKFRGRDVDTSALMRKRGFPVGE